MKIDVLMVRPLEEPEMAQIEDSLEGYYKATESDSVQAVYPFRDGVALVCDEEGKYRQIPNRALKHGGEVYDIVHGPFFLCGTEGDHFVSLPEDLREKYTELFRVPEFFFMMSDGRVMRVVSDGSEPAMVIA